MPHKSIFQEYLLKMNNHHKGIYGLYLYYCYLLGVFPKNHPKQYLSYSIRQEIKKLDSYSKQTEFMVNNKIETIEDLESGVKSVKEEFSTGIDTSGIDGVKKSSEQATESVKKFSGILNLSKDLTKESQLLKIISNLLAVQLLIR